jgi:3-dehydroquinate synthase
MTNLKKITNLNFEVKMEKISSSTVWCMEKYRTVSQSILSDKKCRIVFFVDKNVRRKPDVVRLLRVPNSVSVVVDSGEKLKSIKMASTILGKIEMKIAQESVDRIVFVAVGGGSVGDFVGFLASVYKRGVKLVHVPTTWLSAIDSAHGGKNALNGESSKNQLGTVYPADEIFLIGNILKTQPLQNVLSGWGECLKIAYIQGGDLWEKIVNAKSASHAEVIFQNIDALVAAKMRVVKQDPYEKTGVRRVLNLGHTVGHALETLASLPHGQAVLFGMYAEMEMAISMELSLENKNKKALEVLNGFCGPISKKYSATKWSRALLRDKKNVGAGVIEWVVPVRPGQTTLHKSSVAKIIGHLKNMGWVL